MKEERLQRQILRQIRRALMSKEERWTRRTQLRLQNGQVTR